MKNKIILIMMGMMLIIGCLNAVSGAINWADGHVISYYEGEDNTDSIGSDDLTEQGSPVYETGVNGNGMRVTETDFLNDSSHSISGIGTGEWTVALWMKKNSFSYSSMPVIWGQIDSWVGSGQWGIGYNLAGTIHLETYSGPGTDFSVNISDGDWHSVILERASNTITAYIDNQSAGTKDATGHDFNSPKWTLGGAVIGGRESDFTYDEVAILDRAMTLQERSWYYEGDYYNPITIGTDISLNLTAPDDASVIISDGVSLNTTEGMSGGATDWEWDNITFYTWSGDGELFNSTLRSGLSGNYTAQNLSLGGLESQKRYYWNAYACYSNATFSNCTWSPAGNHSFYTYIQINVLDYADAHLESVRRIQRNGTEIHRK